MKLMLGYLPNQPSLLVDVGEDFESSSDFNFYVVNGAWDGRYYHGHITIWSDEPWSTIDKSLVIICQDQDRLRGNYQDVFDNFDNLNYIAPKPKITFDNFDDDIPF